VKIFILLCTIVIHAFAIVYDLPSTIWFLGWAVAATPFYLYRCTRWNRSEQILIFSLVAVVCYVFGKLICLQRELQRLNGIVFDNAMMQGIDQQSIHIRERMRRMQKGGI